MADTAPEMTETIKLEVLPYQIRATFPDGTLRVYQTRKTASRALNVWHTNRWRSIVAEHESKGLPVPAYTTEYDWSDRVK